MSDEEFSLEIQDPPPPRAKPAATGEVHQRKPSGYKWLNGERGTWWYRETAYGVKTGCPCCGRIALGYGVMKHAADCPRNEGQE